MEKVLKFNESKENILTKLESSPDLHIQEKVNIFLVYSGLKPATELGRYQLDKDRDKEDIVKASALQDNRVKDILTDLNLPFSTQKDKRLEGKDRDNYTYLIAQNEETLAKMQELMKAHEKMIDGSRSGYNQYALEFGEMFGFPQTATIAFNEVSDQKTSDTLLEQLPEDISNTEVGKFYNAIHPFRLSKDHWKEELKIVEIWANAVKKDMPHIYQNITGYNIPYEGNFLKDTSDLKSHFEQQFADLTKNTSEADTDKMRKIEEIRTQLAESSTQDDFTQIGEYSNRQEITNFSNNQRNIIKNQEIKRAPRQGFIGKLLRALFNIFKW